MNRTAKLIARKIRPQFGQSAEEKLMFAIFEQALKDAFCSPNSNVNVGDTASAQRYLACDMFHARACGVDPEWIRRVIERIAGLPLIHV